MGGVQKGQNFDYSIFEWSLTKLKLLQTQKDPWIVKLPEGQDGNIFGPLKLRLMS